MCLYGVLQSASDQLCRRITVSAYRRHRLIGRCRGCGRGSALCFSSSEKQSPSGLVMPCNRQSTPVRHRHNRREHTTATANGINISGFKSFNIVNVTCIVTCTLKWHLVDKTTNTLGPTMILKSKSTIYIEICTNIDDIFAVIWGSCIEKVSSGLYKTTPHTDIVHCWGPLSNVQYLFRPL